MNYFDQITQNLLSALQDSVKGGDTDDIVAATELLSAHFLRRDDVAYNLAIRMTELAELYDPYAMTTDEWYDTTLSAFNTLSGDDYCKQLRIYKQVNDWQAVYDVEPDRVSAENCANLAQDILDYILERVD